MPQTCLVRGSTAPIRPELVNGVDVAPLVEAELDRRDPERAKMRPTEPDGFREVGHPGAALGLTEDSLAAHTEPVQAPGWPPAESFPLRECLLIVLNEEWHHRKFAERDLDALDQ